MEIKPIVFRGQRFFEDYKPLTHKELLDILNTIKAKHNCKGAGKRKEKK